MAVIDELVTLLGLDIDPKAESTAYKFGFLLGGIAKGAVVVGTALAGAATAVYGYAAAQAAAIDGEQELAATLGVSYDRFQELAYAAKLSGGDVNTLSADLEKLQENLVNPATGVQNKALTALGISAKDAGGKLKSADKIVDELAGKFDKLTKAEQNTYAKQLRISPATVRLLQNGQKGLADMAQEARDLGIILDQDAADSAAAFGDSLDRVKATAEGVGRSLIVSLIPGITKVVDGVTNWIKANRALIAAGITQVVNGVAMGFDLVWKAVTAVWEVVSRFLPELDSLTEGFDATQAIAIAVALAIGAAGIAAAIAAAPFIAMAAAVAAVVLVVEDLYALFTGGESLIGSWIASFTEAYPQLAAVFGGIIELVGAVASAVGGTLVDAFGFLSSTMTTVFEGLISDVQTVLGWIDKAIGAVRSLTGSGAQAQTAFAAAGTSGVPAGVVAGGTGGSTSTQQTNITINGAGDPRAVGQEVVTRGGLGASLQQSRPGASGPVTR